MRLWRYDGRALAPGRRRRPGLARRRSRATAGLTPTPGRHRLARAGERGRRASGSRSAGRRGRARARPPPALLPIVGALLDAERQRAFLAEELTSRYEEIDLLYAISEILGQTVQLEEATQTIVREVSTVVGRAAGLDHGVRRGGRACSAPWRRAGSASRASRRCRWTTTARSRPGSTASGASWPTTPPNPDVVADRLRRAARLSRARPS